MTLEGRNSKAINKLTSNDHGLAVHARLIVLRAAHFHQIQFDLLVE
jgi:metal-dependent HD superfamily phosphatase/phosphodiesterase